MNARWIALLVALAAPFSVTAASELTMVSEHPVEGIAAGNLSGLAWCGDALWAVSDREDNVLYRLDVSDTVWQAEAERFELPPVPSTGLSWGVRMRSAFTGMVRSYPLVISSGSTILVVMV